MAARDERAGKRPDSASPRSGLFLAALASGLAHASLLLLSTNSTPASHTSSAAPSFASVELIEFEPEPRPAIVETVERIPKANTRESPRPTPSKARRARPLPRPAQAPPVNPQALPGALALVPGRSSPPGEGSRDAPRAKALIASDSSYLRTLPADAQRLEGPRPPTPPNPRAGIVELANGNLGYTDPAGYFNAYIKPDGSVTFIDSKNVAAKVCVAFVCVGGGQVRQVEAGGKEQHHTMGVDFALVPLGVGGVMGRRVGTNRRETAFLKRTFDMRLDMSLRWQRTQIVRQLAALSDQLEEAWADPRYADRGARRELFRQLWRECDADDELPGAAIEDLPRTLLKARREAATKARRRIETFYFERSGQALW